MPDGGRREMVALNADVVGYSRLMADDQEHVAETLAGHRRIVTEAVAAPGGTLLDFVGDNFMALFDDALAAVGAAIDVTRSVEGVGVGGVVA